MLAKVAARKSVCMVCVAIGCTVLTCMKAVATITPDPKYLVIKKANGGTRMRFVLAAAIGSRAPANPYQLMPKHLVVQM